MNAKLIPALAPLALLIVPAVALAVGPGTGTESRSNFRVGSCHVDNMTVKYELDSLMGEPTVNGAYKWNGEDGCELPYSTTIWLELRSGSAKGYVKLSPTAPDEGEGYGMNTTGSPSWSKTVCGYNGTSKTGCMSADEAKRMWKTGHVAGFKVTH